ncbi:MAG: HAMP domain-containing protein, partial [Gammaproteobacteria bacterium]|nr:HAMP domain-containing protein [Gammaproteobacteria bacterium]MBU1725468.1 HAMP domain-containing protein [Gammaproteobacteria bacterium]MBU2005575.1 HAMP domain-containing protein [Gammaproteobacteria bacterium]
MADPLSKRIWQWLPAVMIFLLLLASLSLLNMATLSQQQAERYGDMHLYLSAIILLLLSIVIFVNLVRVFHQWRTRQAGSRFTLRLMTGFLVLSLLPALFVSLFSVNLVGERIDRWFAVPIERALDDSVELSQIALETRRRQHLAELERLANAMRGKVQADIPPLLDHFLQTGAQEVFLTDPNQNVVALATEDTELLIPHLPDRSIFQTLEVREYYSELEPKGDDQLSVQVAIRVRYGAEERPQAGVLIARFPVSEREQSLSKSVIAARNEYKLLNFQREAVKNAFRLIILVVMVMTVLFSLWAAFVFSRRLTRPVRTLVEGTLAVAAGDLEKKLPVSERDDFSLLARSFNTMTKRLSDAQQEREHARRQLQQEHDYLHVVLEHLSSGVITLDESGVIRRINSAASNILRQPLLQHAGQTLPELCDKLPDMHPFLEVVQPHLLKMGAEGEWQSEISLSTESGRLLLVCRGAPLPGDASGRQGSVLVFDDVTDLIQAEHDAAWSEVARRLAHEIKNPLTPIQLSAERLNRKLGKVLDEESASFLTRMTNTIVQQVDTLKTMVNAFSEYARAPALHLQRVDLNTLVQEVTELYRMNEARITIKLSLDEHLPALRLDPSRIRQLLVNLIKNALEALEESHTSNGCIVLDTRWLPQAEQVLLSIHDNGPGIPAELLPRLFEPYVTSKHKGTGLGLAIVKKIVEEHSGHLGARNHEDGGAMITIRFPLD